MKIRKHKAHGQTAADESEDKQLQCSKCGKKLASTDTAGMCKHCIAAIHRRRAGILSAVIATGGVVKKYGPKAVSLAMKVIKK